MPQTDKAEAVLLMTHFVNSTILAQIRRLRAEAGPGRDVYLLLNTTPPAEPATLPADFPEGVTLFRFSIEDARALGYPRKGRAFGDRHVELFTMIFHRANPGYRHIWSLEYDVDFTGRWSGLFDNFAESSADLICTTLTRRSDIPDWENWRYMDPPAGDGLPDEVCVRGFLPCSRYSATALDEIDRQYRKGWDGHFEALLPSLLNRAGLLLEDLGGDGEFVRPENRNRFYRNTRSSASLAPGSFVFRPSMLRAGDEPDTLWHPVKPPDRAPGWATGRKERLMRLVWRLAARFNLTSVIPALSRRPPQQRCAD